MHWRKGSNLFTAAHSNSVSEASRSSPAHHIPFHCIKPEGSLQISQNPDTESLFQATLIQSIPSLRLTQYAVAPFIEDPFWISSHKHKTTINILSTMC